MKICNCGKEYKIEKSFLKHINSCPFSDLNIDIVLSLGNMIVEIDEKIFYANYGKTNKLAKENKISFNEAKKIIQREIILKYKKSLWGVYLIWKETLIPSEFRQFLKWVFKTYSDITVLSLKSVLTNQKIIYRFNLENTVETIRKRIDESLIFIHENGNFNNDFEFIASIHNGKISVYFVLFNDWLATKWFGRLEKDLQQELEEYVELAAKTVLERLKPDEFDELNKLACSDTPLIAYF